MPISKHALRPTLLKRHLSKVFHPHRQSLVTHHEYSESTVVADGRCMRSGHDFVIKDGTIKLNLPPFSVATITYKA